MPAAIRIVTLLLLAASPLAMPGPSNVLGSSRDDPPAKGKDAPVREDEAEGTWIDLVGRWSVVSVVNSGRKVEPADAGFDSFRVQAPRPGATTGASSKGWFIPMLDGRFFCEMEVRELDPSQSPKSLVLSSLRKIEDGKRGQPTGSFGEYRAIYRLVGDELTICLVHEDEPKPKAFTADEGSKRMLIKLRRADGKR